MYVKTLAPGFEIRISDRDLSTLRSLAGEIARVASLPEQRRNREFWTKVNDNRKDAVAVMVREDEIPWHELAGFDELRLECSDPFSRSAEQEFRRILFQWRRCPCDMVVEPYIRSGLVILDTGFGLAPSETLIQQGEGNPVHAQHYDTVIRDEGDIEKIVDPVITHNEEMSEALFRMRTDLFGDILDVRKCGVYFSYTAPWDDMVRYWGPERLLMDLVDRPEFVHAAIDRYIGAWKARLRRYEEQNLLGFDEGNFIVGSGGYGYTSDLPGGEYEPGRVRLGNQWGFATAQLFGSVSPAMHEEFGLRHEIPMLSLFGLSYYGCCEPLHGKIHILRKIPNLRKISISPWADVPKAVENTGGDFVLSIKPNPAVFVGHWDPAAVEKGLDETLRATRGCAVEIIMKDISTVEGRPERLFEWARIAAETADRYR